MIVNISAISTAIPVSITISKPNILHKVLLITGSSEKLYLKNSGSHKKRLRQIDFHFFIFNFGIYAIDDSKANSNN